ncbi:trimeric intracellular cation channel family protein [Sneathiella limimaris]|uniref:trimeric intracellular cation channel family protein n=1 Tax=Sneathiella limimaris TaxID=1964213 RepID=UPI00146E7001|nr:trimeric intracellular cation channel family protein [Sneathiella limimaris]
MEILDLIRIIDLTGVAVFAATGSLAASRKQLDIIGFALMATLTGVGGGTLRDILLDRPVFWIEDQIYLLICFGVAVLVFISAHRLQRRYVALLWADAVGLSVFAVMGAHIALRAGSEPVIATVFGVMTATFGGLLRDVVAGETPLALKQEVYVTAALVASGLYVLANLMAIPALFAVLAAAMAGFIVRGGAIQFGWVLPGYKSRAGRDYT